MNRVLIIEDEKITAEAVKAALAMKNVDADIAENGEKGLAMFEERDYDLILLDLKMPGMDGEEILMQIRKEDPFVDVVIYTNYQEFADIKKLTNIGIQGYVNKGAKADLEELVDMIMRKMAPLEVHDIEKMVRSTPRDMLLERRNHSQSHHPC